MFTITLTFITNVATISQKENEFLMKTSLFIAGLHFGHLMHLTIEFLFFIIFFSLVFLPATFTQNIPQVQKVRLFDTLGMYGFRYVETHTLNSGCI